jgi:uncharacterized lipoprotein
MKLNFIIILIFFFALSACKKNQQDRQQDSWFQIEIKSPANFDCRVPEIIFLDRQQEAYQIIGDSGGVYVASGLPKVLYPVGTRMYVLIQRPDNDQWLVCTTQGPSYPQVHITSVK